MVCSRRSFTLPVSSLLAAIATIACLSGCSNDSDGSDEGDIGALSIAASSTNFSFGGLTACGCNGPAIVNELKANHPGWGGVAAPEWMGTPYLGAANTVNSSCGNPGLNGTPEMRNCASGTAGCGTCWRFTTTGEPNIYGSTSPGKGKVAYGLVLDNCEASNSFGPNQQWCVPYSGESAGCKIEGGCWQDAVSCPGQQDLGQFTSAGAWLPGSECGSVPTTTSADGWKCTNLAGQPTHFDFAIDQANGVPWSAGDNPLLTAELIECPQAIDEVLAAHCGANASATFD